MAQAKGYRGMRKNVFRRAKEAVLRAGNFAFRDRRVKKRDFRRSWILVINNACRLNGLKYSEFIYGLKKASIEIDRKVLAEMARNDAPSFREIVKKVKAKA